MKKNLLLFCLLLTHNLMISQTITVPFTRGGNTDAGTITTLNLNDASYSTVTFDGTEPSSEYKINKGSRGGINYYPSNNSLYICLSRGERLVGRVEGYGTIFRYDLSTKKTSVVFKSNSTINTKDHKGDTPIGNMLFYKNKFYGICKSGGNNNLGVIYSIDPENNDQYEIVHHFEQGTGGHPTCRPYLEGSVLYGGGETSSNGGYFFYKYDIDSKTYTPFYETSVETVVRDIFYRNGFLYAAVAAGIAKHKLSTGNTTDYYLGFQPGIGGFCEGFSYHNGSGKWRALFRNGGIHNNGTLCEFTWSAGGLGLNNIHSFATDVFKPDTPLTDGLLGNQYGVAPISDGSDQSVLYQISPLGIKSILHSFNGGSDGSFVRIQPILAGSKLYGITEQEGDLNSGTIWYYDFETNTYQLEKTLGFESGKAPLGGLVPISGTESIISATSGGKFNKGALLTYNHTNKNITNVPITASDVVHSWQKPIYYNNEIWMLMVLDPSSGQITYKSTMAIAKLDKTTGQFSDYIPISPNSNSDKTIVGGNIIHEGNKVYGASNSSLWVVDLNTKIYTSLHNFDESTEGTIPECITKNNNLICGVLSSKGTNNKGSLFKCDISSATPVYTTLYTPNNFSLDAFTLKDENTLVGTSEYGGTNNEGTIWEFNLNTSTFEIKASFNKATTGTTLSGIPKLIDGNLYGITKTGADNGLGTIYKYNIANEQLSSLLPLSKETGYFSWNAELFTNFPPIANAGNSQMVIEGNLVTLDGSASSDPDPNTTLSYTWTSANGISLTGSNTATPGFTAPSVNVDTDYTFELTVSDGSLEDKSTVTITIIPQVVGIDELENTDQLIYPNPTKGKFRITSPNTINRVKIFNLNGQLVLDTKYSGQKEVELDIFSLPKGLYIIRILGIDSTTTQKIIKI